MNSITPADQLANLKGKSLGYLSLLTFALLVVISLFTLLFPELIAENELPKNQLIVICLCSGLIILLGGLFSFNKNTTIGFILFFVGIFLGCSSAIFFKQTAEQFQNSMLALSISLMVATYFITYKSLILVVAMSVLLINIAAFISGTSIAQFLVSYIFFNIIALASIWISTLRVRSEQIIINDAMKNAKLSEIGFVSSSIIHEIINPLAVIRQSLEVITTKSDQSNDGKVEAELLKKYLQMAQKHAINIHEIIKSISSLVKYQENYHLPLLNTASMFTQLKYVIENFSSEYQLKINLPKEVPDIFLEGKESEILQILTNLTRNACNIITHEKTGQIWLEVEHSADFYSIKICDTGPGLSDEVQRKLGKAFNSGSTEGLGLGLSISMALAEKNKASMKYSRDNNQTTFELLLSTQRIPSSIVPSSVKRTYSGEYAHLLALEENIILIIMRDIKLELTDFKILMTEEFHVIGETPFHYIVITHKAELSKETREYFNTPEMTKLFLSGSIIGQGKVVTSTINFFTRMTSLPYPVKLFKNYDEAISWVNALTQK
jgi:signal transduction histidine kinase/glutaredoxin-related protein